MLTLLVTWTVISMVCAPIVGAFLGRHRRHPPSGIVILVPRTRAVVPAER